MNSNKIMVKFTKLGTKMASWCGFKTLRSLSNGNGNGNGNKNSKKAMGLD